MNVSEDKQLKDISFEKVKKGDELYISYIIYSQKNINYYPDQFGTVIKINKTKKNKHNKNDKVISKTKVTRKVTSIVLLNDKNEEITIYNQDNSKGFGGYTNDYSIYLKKLIQ
jgi:hypothetical protein